MATLKIRMVIGLIAMSILTVCPFVSFAQVVKPFTQRTSVASPDQTIYHIKGDFTIIGNTNMTLRNYSDNGSNSNTNMDMVDIDNDASTINSSSAQLNFREELGSNAECSRVIYAGLYWSGRNSSGQMSVVRGNAVSYHNGDVFGPDNSMSLSVRKQQYSIGNQTWRADTFSLNDGAGNTYVFILRGRQNNVSGASLSISINGGTFNDFTAGSFTTNGNNNRVLRFTFSEPYIINTGSVPIAIRYLQLRNNQTSLETEDLAAIVVNGKYLYKNEVKFKYENEEYQTITVNTDDILYPNGQYNNMYVGYAEVTDYVQAHGQGNYFLADMYLENGDGGSVGYYGGWGLVVVYENSKMRWRDITIFDGYAHVRNATNANLVEVPISGFKAVQVGKVDVKVGFMAGEGDVSITGDGMEIKKLDNTWLNIPNPRTGATNNFFNSTIQTEGNPRNPNLQNNTGLDIYMFNLDNADKSIITNNQTTTSLRFNTSQDTYVPFFLAMGVNAYIPDAETMSMITSLTEDDYDPELDAYVTSPGDEVIFHFDVKNFGTEDIVNAKVELPLPVTIVHWYTDVENVYPGITVEPYFDATRGTNGTAGWNISYIPAGDPAQSFATLVLACTVTDDCYVLASTDEDCKLEMRVNGTLEGWSYVNGVYFKKESFIKSISMEGACQGVANREDIRVVVDKKSYLEAGNCSDRDYTTRVLSFCEDAYPNNVVPFSEIYRLYPLGTRFYNSINNDEYTIATGFPLNECVNDTIYAVSPSVGATSCQSNVVLKQETVTYYGPEIVLQDSIHYCLGDPAAPLSSSVQIPSSAPDNLRVRYYRTNDGTSPGLVDIVPETDEDGVFFYYVRQVLEHTLGCEDDHYYPIKVVVESPITFTSSVETPSCIGTPVVVTGLPAGGTFTYPASLSEHISVVGNVLTIEPTMPAGIVTVTYINDNTNSQNCPSITERTYTHRIADSTIAGIIMPQEQTICEGSQIDPLVLEGYSGHVERWEQRIGSTGSWTWVPNNTSSISSADLGDLPVGTYYFRALVKDGNCDAKYSNVVKIIVSSALAPAPPTVTSPQFTCPYTDYIIPNPGPGTYRWYSQEVGGNPHDSLRTVHMQMAYVDRYVSYVDPNNGCYSERVLIVVQPNFNPGSIVGGTQTECSVGETAQTIGSHTDASIPSGSGTVIYQWYVVKDGDTTAISGANSATFTPSSYMNEEGIYIFLRKAKNSECDSMVTSTGRWTLTIGEPDATITAVPERAVICSGTGVGLTLSAAGPSTRFRYQWYLNGNPIPGATDRSYVATVPGIYAALVTHRASGCSAMSSAVQAIEVKEDNTPPDVPDNQTATIEGCGLKDLPAVYSSISAIESAFSFNITDDITIDDNLVLTVAADTLSTACPSIVKRTYTVTDECNSSSSFTHTITIQSSTPTIAIASQQNPNGVCTATADIVVPTFTVNDPCNASATANVNDSGVQDGEGCAKSRTWTATYTGTCASAEQKVVTYTWKDNTTPTITISSQQNPNGTCTAATDIVAPTFTVTDVCNASATANVNDSGVQDGEGCNKSRTWTATYTGTCASAERKVVTYTWKDNTTPTISTELTSHNLGCNPILVVPTVNDFTVTDECAVRTPVVSLTRSDTAKDGCNRTLIWTASYTNVCGTTVSKSITYTWKEMTTPTITTTLPLTGTKECNWNYETNGPKQSDFTVNDDCASRPSATVTPGTLDESVACQRSMTWTATYKNACNMDATAKVITYTWPYDVTKPVITAFDTVATPALNCTYVMPDLSASTLYRTTDGCSTPTFVSQSINAGEIYPQSDEQQTIEVVVTVKDNCENTQTATVNVIIPAKLSVTAEADPTPICLGSSSVLTATPASATGTPTYTWTPGATLDATNVATVIATPTAAGNSTYTVTVRDENGCENTANVSVTVNDTVKLSATNLNQTICLNAPIEDIVITVENATLSLSAPAEAGLSLSGTTITGTPTAVGTYNFTITATSNKTPACDEKTLSGTITVGNLDVSATGSNTNCDNKSGSATVTVTGGTAPITYSYAYKYSAATHNSEVNLSTKTGANPTGLDTAVYVVTATDANGCTNSAEFTVGLTNDLTVTVSAEPQHICSGGSFVITPTAPAGTKYSWELPAQNPACSPDCDYVSGTGTGAGQTTVYGENLVNNYTSTVVLTYTVVPTYGVCVGASVPVTVAVDVTTHPIPPITVRDTTVCANIGNVGLTATFANVTASVDTVSWKFLADSVAHLNAVSSSDLTDNYTAAVPATPCNNQAYPYVVYYADEYGCHSQATANVIVSLPATITITGGTNASTIECAADTVVPHLITPSVMPTVKDACDNDISDQWTLTRPTNKVECEGTMEFVYTYKNCDDKTAQWTYTYNITRTTAPHQEGSVTSTRTVECLAAATAPTTLPMVKDVCGKTLTNPTMVKTENIANCEGTVTYTYTYKDCVDSQFVWNFVYTIDRTTKPTVNATGIEAAKTVDCIDKATAPTTIPTATGKCEDTPITGVLTRTVDNPNPLTCEGTRTYTYTYTDCAGQTATWSYVYTIEAEPFADPTDVTKDVACIADTFAPHTNATLMPTVKDNCNGDIAPTLPPTKTVNYDGCSGTVAYTYVYEDCEGNTQDWTYTYNIAKPTAPALTGTWPSNQTNVNSCYADRPAFPTKAAVKALYTASCGKTLTVDSVETVVDNDNCGWEIQCKYTITDGCTPVNHTITYKGGDKTKPVIATGYTTTLSANVSNCTYTYPDFTTSVKGYSTDNCTAQANLTVTQNPADGSSISQTASAQTLPVKVYVADACGNKDSVTVTVTVPASLALTIDTSASDCYNTADGFLNYTITGGVADYTLTLTGPTAVTATQTAAGSYSFTGLADGSYTLEVTDANGCVAQASTTIQQINTTLQIVANSHSWTYDGSAHSDNGYKVTFGSENYTSTSGNDVTLSNGDVVTDVTVTGSITNVTESPVANALGTGIKVMRGTRDVTCFYNIDTTFGKLTINNSGDLALNCVDQSKTYDGTALSYTAVPTVTTGTTVSYSTDGGATWSTTVPSITNVSESPLTVNVKAENSNYETAYCDYKLTINPAPLTIKLDSTKIYDGTAFVSDYASTPAGYTITGLVSGDAVTAGTVTSSDIHKGDYVYNATATITTPFATTKGIGNYSVVYDLKQHIVCRDVTLTSATASRKYNGENLSDHTVTVSGSGWLSGKAATYDNFASIKDKGSKKNAFTYTLAAGELATDYCVTIDTGKLTVNCREITITAASLTNIPYDGNVHSSSAFTVTGDGMVSDESVTPVISGSIQFPSQSPVTNAITSYTFTPASTTDNYCVTTVNGTLTMECVSKTIVITADNGEWTYDGTTHTQKSYKLTVDGGTPITVPLSANGDYKFPNGDSLHVTISGEVKNVTTGVNNVVAGWTLYHGDENLLAASNNCYNISKVDGTLKVNCRHITLTSGSASKTYNGSELKKETVTIGGDGMAPNETLSYTNFASITNVGSTSNTFSYNFVSPALASNYCVTPVNGTLTVDCKEVTLTAKNADKTYDGSPLTQSGFTASALETGDTHTFTVTMTSGSTITNVGTQANVIATVDGTPVITGVRTAVGNYCVTTVEGSLEVKKKDLTITANSDSKVYDGTPLTNSGYSNTALAPTDHIESVVVTGSQTPVGTSNNVPSDAVIKNANNEDVTGNYNITYQNGKLTVTSNTTPIVIASGTNSWMYNGVAHSEETYTVTYGGTPVTDVDATGKIFTLPTGDKVTITNPNSITNVSETADNNNTYSYSIQNSTYYTSVTANYGKLTITPRTVELTSATDSKVYDGTALTRNQQTDVTVSGDGFVTGEGATYDITGTQTLVGSSSNAFTYTLNSGTLAGNYNISKTEGTLTVTKANAISLTCPPSNSTEKTYDGTVLQPIAQAHGIGDDVIKIEYSTNGTTWSETAPWISHVTTQHVDVRASNPNYDTVTCEYTLKINCRPVTLTSGTSSRKYNGSALSNTTVTVSGSGWLTGKEASYDNFADITNVGSKKNAFSYTLAPSEVATDYCVTIDTGMLTVTCREITLTSGSATKVYDATPLKKETVTIGGD
ncbi:MAG: hypothetical protein K5890_06190, partial [Bacteroidales bacterium]|nr:hypothetical protein [Bacteroidales bacterium]